MNNSNLMVVNTAFPANESPQALIDEVLNSCLAACVQCLAPMDSYYHWEGAIQNDQERLLLFKTTSEKYPALQRLIERLHPYNVPEIIAIPVSDAANAYRNWLHKELTDNTNEQTPC